jgi:hypothetical protein
VLMTRVWLLYDRSKRMGTFLGIVFISALSVGLLVSGYSPGVSVVSLPLRLSHLCSSADRARSPWLHHVRVLSTNSGYSVYVLVCLVPNSLTRCPRSKPGAIFWLHTIAIIIEVSDVHREEVSFFCYLKRFAWGTPIPCTPLSSLH